MTRTRWRGLLDPAWQHPAGGFMCPGQHGPGNASAAGVGGARRGSRMAEPGPAEGRAAGPAVDRSAGTAGGATSYTQRRNRWRTRASRGGAGGGPGPADIKGNPAARGRTHGPAVERTELSLGELLDWRQGGHPDWHDLPGPDWRSLDGSARL